MWKVERTKGRRVYITNGTTRLLWKPSRINYNVWKGDPLPFTMTDPDDVASELDCGSPVSMGEMSEIGGLLKRAEFVLPDGTFLWLGRLSDLLDAERDLVAIKEDRGW